LSNFEQIKMDGWVSNQLVLFQTHQITWWNLALVKSSMMTASSNVLLIIITIILTTDFPIIHERFVCLLYRCWNYKHRMLSREQL